MKLYIYLYIYYILVTAIFYSDTYHRDLSTWSGSISFNGLILVHLPISFLTVWSSSTVENHCSLHANDLIIRRINMIWWTGCLPVPSIRQPLRSPSSGFAFLPWNEKEPLLRISQARLSRNLWNYPKREKKKKNQLWNKIDRNW